MSLRWNWDEKVGTCEIKRAWTDKGGEIKYNLFSVNLYVGNACLIEIWEDEQTDTYQLTGFWADRQHMKNCLGLAKGYDSIYTGEERSYTFYKEKLNKLDKQMFDCILRGMDNVSIKIESEVKA